MRESGRALARAVAEVYSTHYGQGLLGETWVPVYPADPLLADAQEAAVALPPTSR